MMSGDRRNPSCFVLRTDNAMWAERGKIEDEAVQDLEKVNKSLTDGSLTTGTEPWATKSDKRFRVSEKGIRCKARNWGGGKSEQAASGQWELAIQGCAAVRLVKGHATNRTPETRGNSEATRC